MNFQFNIQIELIILNIIYYYKNGSAYVIKAKPIFKTNFKQN